MQLKALSKERGERMKLPALARNEALAVHFRSSKRYFPCKMTTFKVALSLLTLATADLTALKADDECSEPSCAVSALQRRAMGLWEPLKLQQEAWHEGYYGHEARADISVANYKALMLNISVQQKEILKLWNRSLELEKEVTSLVKQVQLDSGLKVKDYVALEEQEVSEGMKVGGNQPREARVKQWISYMDQEMGQVFRKLNSNGQQVAACGTLMSKNPVPLKLKNQTFESLAQLPDEVVMPGDHVGIGDELWRSVYETITNIHTATKSADNLQEHIGKIKKMLVDYNEGKLIPNEGF